MSKDLFPSAAGTVEGVGPRAGKVGEGENGGDGRASGRNSEEERKRRKKEKKKKNGRLPNIPAELKAAVESRPGIEVPTDKDIRDLVVYDVNVRRGMQYFRKGLIGDVKLDGGRFSATCQGKNVYILSIEFDQDAGVKWVEPHCSCMEAYSRGGICKHIAALMLWIRHSVKHIRKMQEAVTTPDTKTVETACKKSDDYKCRENQPVKIGASNRICGKQSRPNISSRCPSNDSMDNKSSSSKGAQKDQSRLRISSRCPSDGSIANRKINQTKGVRRRPTKMKISSRYPSNDLFPEQKSSSNTPKTRMQNEANPSASTGSCKAQKTALRRSKKRKSSGLPPVHPAKEKLQRKGSSSAIADSVKLEMSQEPKGLFEMLAASSSNDSKASKAISNGNSLVGKEARRLSSSASRSSGRSSGNNKASRASSSCGEDRQMAFKQASDGVRSPNTPSPLKVRRPETEFRAPSPKISSLKRAEANVSPPNIIKVTPKNDKKTSNERDIGRGNQYVSPSPQSSNKAATPASNSKCNPASPGQKSNTPPAIKSGLLSSSSSQACAPNSVSLTPHVISTLRSSRSQRSAAAASVLPESASLAPFSPEVQYSQITITPPRSQSDSESSVIEDNQKERLQPPENEASKKNEEPGDAKEAGENSSRAPLECKNPSGQQAEEAAGSKTLVSREEKTVMEIDGRDGENIEDPFDSDLINIGPWKCNKCSSENPRTAMTCIICNLGVSPARQRQFEHEEKMKKKSKSEGKLDTGSAAPAMEVGEAPKVQISFTRGTKNKRPRRGMGSYFSEFVGKRKEKVGSDEKVVGEKNDSEVGETVAADSERKHADSELDGKDLKEVGEAGGKARVEGEKAELVQEIQDVLSKNVKELKDELRLYSMRLSGRKPELQTRLLAVRTFHYERGDWTCSECLREHKNSVSPICRKCNTIRTLGSVWECNTCEHDNPHGLRCESCNALRMNIPGIKLEPHSLEDAEEAFEWYQEEIDRELEAEDYEISKALVPIGHCELDMPNRKVPSFIASRIIKKGSQKKKKSAKRDRRASQARVRSWTRSRPRRKEATEDERDPWRNESNSDPRHRSRKQNEAEDGLKNNRKGLVEDESDEKYEEEVVYEESDDDVLHNNSYDDEDHLSLSEEMSRLPRRKEETVYKIKVTESEILAEEKLQQSKSKTKVTSLKVLLGNLGDGDSDSDFGIVEGKDSSKPKRSVSKPEQILLASDRKDSPKSSQSPEEKKSITRNGANMISPTPSPKPISSPIDANTKSVLSSATWTCSRCTLINESSHESCEACKSAKPSAASQCRPGSLDEALSRTSSSQTKYRHSPMTEKKSMSKSPEGSPKLDLEAMLFDESSEGES